MSVTARSTLTSGEIQQVHELVQAVALEDGVPPLSDQVLLHLSAPGLHLLAHEGASLAGYAHLEGSTGEVAVRPSYRRRGLGRELVTELMGHGVQQLWARADHPGAARLATSLGFTRTRVLRLMTRPLGDLAPVDLAARTFVVGQDEEALVAVNARAFATHPEQGRWTVADVVAREQAPWFDASGVFLAEREGRLVGFHWTKAADGVGEVYVVGVDPSEQGTGLGKALTLLGMHHLQERGLPTVKLYVDESNPRAIALYEKLGFTTASRDVSWSVAPSP